jgi:hypothetical protein
MGKKNRQLNHQLAYHEHSCTAPREAIGRKRRDGNHSPQKNNSIQDSQEMKKTDT